MTWLDVTGCDYMGRGVIFTGHHHATTTATQANVGQRRLTAAAAGGARDATRLEPQVCFHFLYILFILTKNFH